MYVDPLEIQRLKLLFDNAREERQKAIASLNQTQIETASGRSAYFERLTIGSGAVIAAIVSFLGGHANALQPAWLLRASLISLALAMVAGLYRSYRYPYYMIHARRVAWIEASKYYQVCKANYLRVAPEMVADIFSGKVIDRAEALASYKTSDEQLESLVTDSTKQREHLFLGNL
jgi:hypothetical protein